MVFSSWIIILFEGHAPIYPGGQAITGGNRGTVDFHRGTHIKDKEGGGGW